MAHEAVSSVYPALPSSQRALDRTIVHGVSWTGGLKGISLLLSWASTIAVARILSPEDYGLVAMATLYLGLTTMVTELGLGSAIVAMRDLTEKQIAQLHTVAALVGVVAFLVSCAAAVPLSRFFKAPALAAVVVVLSTSVVLDSLRTVPAALLAKEMRFKFLAVIDALKVIVAISLTLGLAIAGARHWALVLGNLIAALVTTVVLLVFRRQKFAWPQFGAVRPTLGFSSKLLTGQLAWYGYSNADFLIAGRILGKIALGEYTLAWTLTSTPGEKIMSVLGRVMPTTFSAVQRDSDALRRYFLLFTEALAIVIVPASVGLALVAPDFVLFVFGEKWSAAVVPLQILCCYSSVHVLAIPLTPVLQVKGQAGFPMRMGLLALAILPPAFLFAGSRWGTIGIAASWLFVYPVTLVPTYRRVFKTLGIRLGHYLTCIGPTILSAAVMALVVVTVRAAAHSHVPLGVLFTSQVAAGAAAFIAAALVLERRRMGALTELVRSIRS